MSDITRVVIAEDEELFRKGLIQLIETDPRISVVGECENGAKLIRLLEVMETVPDIILMDLKMPDTDGVEATKFVKKKFDDQIRIIILTSYYRKPFITNMIQMGASALMRKDSKTEEVIETIIRVHKDGFYYSEETLGTLQENWLLHTKSRRIKTFDDMLLTERELEVLRMICEQKKTMEIADQLFISGRTVEGHRNSLLQKTGAKNTAGLVLYAIENGIVLI